MKTHVRWESAVEVLEARIAPATFIVNSLLDGSVNPVPDGILTLREAITAATTNVASGDAPAGDVLADSIVFAAALAGKSIQLDQAMGEFVIDGGGQLSITGPGATAGAMILGGTSVNRVFTITDTVDAVLLSHLTITRGNAPADNGGGIFNQGSLYLDDVLVTKNTALGGGGIVNSGSAAKLSIVHSRIEENTTNAGNGGGILNTGSGAPLLIRDTTIANNFAREGGGIYHQTGGTALISASKITGNHGDSSGDGAGIFNRGTMTLDETTVSGNVGLGGGFYGGGIRSDGSLTVLNSTISGNLTQGQGGGIYTAAGTLTIIDSTIANNTALGSGGGGGILTNAATTITNSTIVGNIDATAGSAGAGGIVVGSGNPLLVNTVVAGNFAASGTSADVRGAFSAGSANNFLGVGDGAAGFAAPNGNQLGTAAAPLDAKLGPLQDNGGRTFTMLPLASSPLIDAGLNASAISATGATLLSDQRGPGFARTVEFNVGGGATVDIGAVEFASAADASGVTTFTYTNIGGTQINVTLTGGGTFDLLRNTQGTTLSRLEIHGATAASALAVKVLTPGGTVNVDGLLADGPLKSITFGKGVRLTGSVGVEGALGSLALDTMDFGTFIRTGGTPAQVLSIKTNGDFGAAVDTTGAVGKLSLPKFNFNGAIRAASIGDITALGFNGSTNDDGFGLGDDLKQDLIATSGAIGKLTAGANGIGVYDVLAGPSPLGKFGGLVVKATIGVGTGVSDLNVTAAAIGKIAVAVTSAGGAGSVNIAGIGNSNFTATNGGIAGIAATLKYLNTGMQGGNAIGACNFTAAGGIGAVTAISSTPGFGTILSSTFMAGTKTLATWTNLATAKLQFAALKNSSLGSISATSAINGSRFIAAGNIGAITAPGSFNGSLVLAGASLGADGVIGGTGADADFFVRPVSIGAVTLKQPVNFTIAAGIVPFTTTFGSGGDAAAGAGKIGGTSKIGAIKITASFSTTTNNGFNTHTSAIEAGAIASLKVNASNVVPTGGSGILLDTDASGTDTAADTFIRLL